MPFDLRIQIMFLTMRLRYMLFLTTVTLGLLRVFARIWPKALPFPVTLFTRLMLRWQDDVVRLAIRSKALRALSAHWTRIEPGTNTALVNSLAELRRLKAMWECSICGRIIDGSRCPHCRRWQRINDEPFEYCIDQGMFGDEFVKLADGSCLRRCLPATQPFDN